MFVQNFAPGAAERLGLGAEALRARFPRLVTCSISGYGARGPYRDAKAYDLLIQAEAGLLSVTGTAERRPRAASRPRTSAPACTPSPGSSPRSTSASARARGTALEVSLFDALTEWMGYPLYYAGYGGTPPARAGTEHAAIAPYGTFAAGDGAEVVLAIQNEREWVRSATRVLERPELAVDARFDTGAAPRGAPGGAARRDRRGVRSS